MDVVAKLDEHGKVAWIIMMVLGFVLFWPIGLAVLAYMIWSGRMGCGNKKHWKNWRHENWHNLHSAVRPSGNSAFDEYKAETIRRLEDEQTEFRDFLDHLRQSKDKAEFEMFMNGRKAAKDAEPTKKNGDDADKHENRPDPD